jgi:hypothetical protein
VPSWVISGLSLLPAFAVRHPVCIRPSCTSWSRRLSRTAPGRGLDHAPPWWVTSPPPQGPSLGSGLFCPGPSSLNRPHPPHSQVHRDFTACRLIRDAFAVRERLGDPRAVPGFRCSFLPGMPSSPTPGRPASKCSRASMPTWPSPFDHRLGTPKIPAIRSTRASHFVASLVRFRYGLPGCSPPYTDQTGTPQPSGTFTSRLSTDRSPSPPLDITTTATGLLCWRDSHPLEWQLASLHGQNAKNSPEHLSAGLPLITDIALRGWHGRKVPCVDGSELARRILTARRWSVQPCVRPVGAVHMTAYPGSIPDVTANT